MFFGSARSKDRAQYDDALDKASTAVAAAVSGSEDHALALGSLDRLKKGEWMCAYMEKIRQLAQRLTEWSIVTKYRLSNQVPLP
jgi:hypothetical protein